MRASQLLGTVALALWAFQAQAHVYPVIPATFNPGQTPAQVHANFPIIMAQHINATTIKNLMFVGWTNHDMCILQWHMTPVMLANTTNWVHWYNTSILAYKWDHACSHPFPRRKISVFNGPGSLDYTFEEIYLDFRTASGGLSLAAALSSSAVYVGTNVYIAYTAGYTVGTAVSNMIEVVAPDLNTAIGGTIDQMVQEIQVAYQQYQQAQYETQMQQIMDNMMTGGSMPADGTNNGYAGDDNGDGGGGSARKTPVINIATL